MSLGPRCTRSILGWFAFFLGADRFPAACGKQADGEDGANRAITAICGFALGEVRSTGLCLG